MKALTLLMYSISYDLKAKIGSQNENSSVFKKIDALFTYDDQCSLGLVKK